MARQAAAAMRLLLAAAACCMFLAVGCAGALFLASITYPGGCHCSRCGPLQQRRRRITLQKLAGGSWSHPCSSCIISTHWCSRRPFSGAPC
jgi:hypothetical protein